MCCGAHLSLWFDHTRIHTHTHMIHWQVDPRSRISIPLQVPAKNEARNEWGTFALEECLKNCNLPFHSNAKSKASACRNIAQLMFWVDCLLFLSVSSCSNSPFLSSMNGNTHKPQLSVRVSYFTKRPQSTNLPSVSGVPQDGSILPSDPLQGDQTQSVGVWSARGYINKSLRRKRKIVIYTSSDFYIQSKSIHRKREKRQLRGFSGMLCALTICSVNQNHCASLQSGARKMRLIDSSRRISSTNQRASRKGAGYQGGESANREHRGAETTRALW